jgi:hypothetical protein
MPSPTRSSSSKKRTAATRIQKLIRGKQPRKKVTKLKASRKIQSRVRGKQTRRLISRIKTKMLTNDDCSICFEPMSEKITTLLPCGDRFHNDCIKKWFTSRKKKCPNCRSRIINIKPQRRPKQTQLTQIEQERLRVIIAHLEQQVREQGIVIQELQESTLVTLQQALEQEIRALEIEETVSTVSSQAREQFYNYRSNSSSDAYYEFLEEIYNITDELVVNASVNSYDASGLVETIRNRNNNNNSNRNSWWSW